MRSRRYISSGLLLIATVLLLSFPVSLQAAPEDGKVTNITAPMVKHMLDSGTGIVIHALSQLEFEMQHITGTINISIDNLETSTKLPEDKDTPLVFYCMGKK